MIEIPIVTVKDEDRISKPERPIKLDQYPDLEPARAWELANLVRIAGTDYQCFNDWFNDLKGENVFKEFILENNRKFKGIDPKNNHVWIYVKKEITNSAIKAYTLLTEKDVAEMKDNAQYSDENYYKYKIIKTYEYKSYYPTKLDVDIDRFGFVAKRKEGDKNIVFVVFRGTRELGEWFNNSQFKQVNFLEMEENSDGVKDYGKVSLGFNKMYTGFRPGVLIDYDNINDILRRGDTFIRGILEKIDNIEIKHKSIYQAVNEFFESEHVDNNAAIYIAGHSLGGALATIAAMHIVKKDSFKTPINLYTFASPRVGDNAFADKFNQFVAANKIKAFRFANSEDIVTKVPFSVWFKSGIDLANSPLLELTRSAFNRFTGGIFDKDYQHVGSPIYFTHQARKFEQDQKTLKPTATVGDNHNMTITYCGALEK